MQVEVQLFGTFRQFQVEPYVVLDVCDGATVAQVRQAFAAHAAKHWPGFPSRLIEISALASEHAVLLDSETTPTQLAVLPPVSGG